MATKRSIRLPRWGDDADFSVSCPRPPNRRIEVTENLAQLRLEIHPPQQVVEARVVADGVQWRMHFEKPQSPACLVGFLQPFERLVLRAWMIQEAPSQVVL